jgi:iron-sulfur cluster assembly protein
MSEDQIAETNRMVTVTDRAQQEIRAIFERETNDENTGLRLSVIGGGCSGLSYDMGFSEARPDDSILEYGGFKLLLDPKSTIYLKGIALDFQDGLMGKGFVFSNPNATNTCGCGESFSV